MLKPLPIPPTGFDELSIEEKIDYVQSLWDRIATHANTVPLTDWQREVLDRRSATFQNDPDAGVSSEQFRDHLRAKISH